MRRAEQLYQKVMSLWHQLHVNMKSVVSWNYLQKDIRTVSGWSLDTVRLVVFSTTFALAPHCTDRPPTARQVCGQSPAERQQALCNLDSHLADFLADSKESSLFTPAERREVEEDVQQAQRHCKDLLLNMETGEMRRMNLSRQKYWGCSFSLIASLISSSAAEKDESVSRAYLSELQGITLRLKEAEQRLMRAIETPPPSRLSGDSADITVRIAEQEVSFSTPWCCSKLYNPC